MDQERFDQITRSLAAGKSRRGFLKSLVGTAFGGALAAAGIADASAKPEVPCKFPNHKCGKGRYAKCCSSSQVCNSDGTCGAPSACVPSCDGKCGGASDGCGGTCDATCCVADCAGKYGGVSDGCNGTCDACPPVGCNTGYPNGDGTCWYTPTGPYGAVCNNLYYGVGQGVCDNNGNCVLPSDL
jgi:hypothetical protein